MRRASLSPDATRGQMPVSRPTCSRKSSPFRASRTAEVATATILSTRWFRASCLYFRRTARPRFIAAAESIPRARVPAPRRTISFSRSFTSNPPEPCTSTTTMWMELLPMSMAAIFMGEGAGEAASL